ncbi:MAG: hypothetical protein A2X25_02690 [Chloroflexi bacterium GWB2_49_20]|nr:MAG: hypothetical protein A2X25_02690 [Chloroflexi bacterium GWB2_49_20]OGN78786.1 MAG: hypothetical protein A2X26_13090 [Chloroflexi bacterium GWC2_49_37]OGN85844.1 MAG: hypothetical protein A2X27_11595 [Chloroflexi bacterium GWD2_49_16]
MNARSPIRSFSSFKQFSMRRGAMFGIILVGALLAFEVFNFSTTDFALTDLLGANLRFLGLRWATILSIAFCGIDFAGIARLFTPEQGRNEPAEVWYLFGAWLLAAAMNAALTWWGVSVAVHNHQSLGSSVVGTETLYKVVPVFVAVMVWLIRVLIIGTFSMAGERLFSMAEGQPAMLRSALQNSRSMPMPAVRQPQPMRAQSVPLHPVPRSEPGYHPQGMAARPSSRSAYTRTESPVTRT